MIICQIMSLKSEFIILITRQKCIFRHFFLQNPKFSSKSNLSSQNSDEKSHFLAQNLISKFHSFFGFLTTLRKTFSAQRQPSSDNWPNTHRARERDRVWAKSLLQRQHTFCREERKIMKSGSIRKSPIFWNRENFENFE